MRILESLSAFFPKKSRPEESVGHGTGSIEGLSHWLTNHETVYDQQISKDILRAVLKNPAAFERLLPHQRTPEVCNKAVSINSHVIQHLTDAQRTPEVCITAVQRNGYAIQHLTDAQRTPEVCLAAVQQDGHSIQHLTDAQRTPEVCLAAVQQNCHAIEHLSEAQRTPELCLVALQTRPRDWRAGSPIRHLSLQDCVHPMVSSWIIANWAACASSLGNAQAVEVARGILTARQADGEGAQPVHERVRA